MLENNIKYPISPKKYIDGKYCNHKKNIRSRNYARNGTGNYTNSSWEVNATFFVEEYMMVNPDDTSKLLKMKIYNCTECSSVIATPSHNFSADEAVNFIEKYKDTDWFKEMDNYPQLLALYYRKC